MNLTSAVSFSQIMTAISRKTFSKFNLGRGSRDSPESISLDSADVLMSCKLFSSNFSTLEIASAETFHRRH